MSGYDVYGIGNALVDMEFEVDDEYLHRHGISKGHMTLVSADWQETLFGSLPGRARRSCGGSAANTLIAISQFGARGFYSCRVANDEPGRFFLSGLRDEGVDANLSPHSVPYEGTTGRCLVFVTPDTERSLNTCLGVSEFLGPENVVEEAVRNSRYVYIEGYLAAASRGVAAAVKTREIAERHGVKTTLTLSDYNMVHYCRSQLQDMIGAGVDHLFCNEEEVMDWTECDSLDTAERQILDWCKTCTITLGARGSRIFDGRAWQAFPAVPCEAVDATGAGDSYSGAFLYALSRGYDFAAAVRLASLTASKVVAQFGARLPRAYYPDILQAVGV